jgi:branched-chain amino acid transport system substrate-binding protein
MKKTLKIMTLLIVACSFLILTACSSQTSSSSKQINIGTFGPYTGDAATDGIQARDGAALAVEQINKSGGVLGSQINLITMDDQGKAPEAMSVVQKMLQQDKVVGLVSGSYSTPTKTVAPVVQQSKTPMVVSYAVNPAITQGNNFVFRTIYTGPIQGQAMAEFAINEKSLKKFAILNVNNDYGNTNAEGFAEYVAKLGGEVVLTRNFVDGTKDFNAILTAVKEKNPDGIYVAAYYNEAAQICSQARQLGINAQMLGGDGFDSPKFIELAGKAAEGAIFSTPFFREEPRKIVQDFIKAYEEKYNKEPDMLSAQTYDSVLLLADAIKRAGSTDKEAIRKALAETKEFEGVTGKISFDEKNEVMKPVILSEVKDGKFVFIKSQVVNK